MNQDISYLHFLYFIIFFSFSYISIFNLDLVINFNLFHFQSSIPIFLGFTFLFLIFFFLPGDIFRLFLFIFNSNYSIRILCVSHSHIWSRSIHFILYLVYRFFIIILGIQFFYNLINVFNPYFYILEVWLYSFLIS